MNILDKFRYKKDDPEQLNIKLDQYSSKQTFKNKENLSKLLSKYLQSNLIWKRINLFIILFMSIIALYVLIEIIKFF